ncbi:RNA-binding protein [Trypanosoma cruzi Dm28c]|uniref:RNA-binding protein n=1 Tax=Trypanosoma cruzi Dm28c TaxID=1416333 RepID=V5BLR5_TRYCR|nr:RNA-binding protein [Trypanosoma cruzi Dm28c]PBJ72848.1 RNA-binding protein [Trypanosoma cruzi cruzi]
MVEMVFSSYERMQVPDLLQNVKPIPVLPESVDGMSSNSPSTHAAIQEEEAMALASVTSEPCLVFDSELLVEKLLLEEECSNCCDDNSADVHNDNTSRQDKLLLTRGFASDNQSRTNLFISNIPHKMEQRELENLFAPYGQILSAAVMRNIHTGKSLGTAFVRYASTEEAMSAIKGMSGKRIGGRAIAVQWAKKQHDYAPVGEARKKISKLFVRNIPLDINTVVLEDMFSMYGPVKSVSIHKDTAPDCEKNSERHIAFITFLADGAAERAAEAVHNTRPFPSCGKVPLMVKLAEDAPQRIHHGTGSKNSANALKTKQQLQGDMGAMSPGQEQFFDAPAVQQCFPTGTGTGAMVVAPTSYFSLLASGGLILPGSVPGAVMGSEAPYPWRTRVTWSQGTGVPFPFYNGSTAATAANPFAPSNACATPPSGSPVSCMNNGGFTSFPMYTTPFCSSTSPGLSGTQADSVAGSPLILPSSLHQ